MQGNQHHHQEANTYQLESIINSNRLHICTISQDKIALVLRDDKEIFSQIMKQQGFVYGHYKLDE